jgi:hypothetical protein
MDGMKKHSNIVLRMSSRYLSEIKPIFWIKSMIKTSIRLMQKLGELSLMKRLEITKFLVRVMKE